MRLKCDSPESQTQVPSSATLPHFVPQCSVNQLDIVKETFYLQLSVCICVLCFTPYSDLSAPGAKTYVLKFILEMSFTVNWLCSPKSRARVKMKRGSDRKVTSEHEVSVPAAVDSCCSPSSCPFLRLRLL